MATTDRGEPDLDALLAEARALRPRPSDDLMARILADADAARPVPAASRPAARPRWMAPFLTALGGWPALGALAASVVLGLGLGVTQPAVLSGLTGALRGEAVSVDLGLDTDSLTLLDG